MYSRPPMGRFPRGMRVPENYGGNAFTASAEEPEEAAEVLEKNEDINTSALEEPPRAEPAANGEAASAAPAMAKPSRGFKLDLGRFFPSNRSFGMEEFLIIALILLLAQGDSGDDTIIFLILLLFIG